MVNPIIYLRVIQHLCAVPGYRGGTVVPLCMCTTSAITMLVLRLVLFTVSHLTFDGAWRRAAPENRKRETLGRPQRVSDQRIDADGVC